MTDEEIRQDLAKLKELVAAHKAPDAPLSTAAINIDGQALSVFSKVGRNLGDIYRLGLAVPDKTFLVYQDERFSFAQTDDMTRRLGRILREKYGIRDWWVSLLVDSLGSVAVRLTPLGSSPATPLLQPRGAASQSSRPP